MSTNTRLTRYEYIGIHISVIMSAVVLVSNLSSVTSSTTVATTTTTTLSPQVTQTTENVNVTSSTQLSSEATSPAGNDTTEATTTLQSGSTEDTTTAQPGATPQSTTSFTTTTATTTTNDLNSTQSPETTIDNMSTQSSTDVMTSETTLTTSDAIPTTTVNTTEETETTTSLETITTKTLHSTPVSTGEGVETTTSTVAPVTVTTTTTQDNSSTPDTTTQTSNESTEAPSTISTDAPQQTTTTQGSSDNSTSDTTTPMPVTSTGTPNSTETTTQATPTLDSNNTTAVSDTTTEATSTHSTETSQTTTTTSVDNTTITRPSRASTTTTQPTTTKSYQIMPVYPDTENAVVEFTFELRFTDCTYNKTTIENKLSVVSSSVDDCKYIRVKSIDEGSCRSGRSKRSATASYISVDTAFGIDAQKGISNGSSVSDDLYTALSNVDDIDVNYLNETKDNFTGALRSKQICDSDVCTSALVGRPGFVCVADTGTQRCTIMYYCDHDPIDCGQHGHCYVETEIQSERVSYSSKCRCTQEEFFRYEGTSCTERVMTWELAVIICASAFGALILVLLFIIIVMCCRNGSNSADVSFEDSEVMYTPSGIASANGRNGRDASKGVENQGYMEVRDTSGSWKPEASANTYAHIESKLRENNYDMQIKRPQVTQFRKSDEITEF